MPVAALIARMAHLPAPVLTAYLDTSPAKPTNQNSPRGYATWLKSSGRELAQGLSPEARRQLQRQLRRVQSYLDGSVSFRRGLVLFAGSDVWEQLQMQASVRNELHWGKPSLQQMAWVLNAHRARGVVVMDHEGASFFRFWLGSVVEDREVAVFLDRSSWRTPHLVGPATPGVQKRHGVQRDRVTARMEAQRRRFAADLARRIARWSKREQISPVILVGQRRQIELVLAALPEKLRDTVALVPRIVPRDSASRIQRELAPVLEDWERQYEQRKVRELVSAHSPARAAVGVDETLDQLQRGRVRELVVARGFKGSARQCLNCGWVSRTADPVCLLCGGETRSRTLRTAVPELATAFGVPMEIVAGEAAHRLHEVGGIGAWLGVRKRPIRKVLVNEGASGHRRRA